jgi:pimeloyl-ACP methyl ester carboxylesterase
VILLHGFPEDSGCWAGVTPALNAAGYRTLAPDQRGYSPGANPPSRRDYLVAALAADVVALADAAGAATFDLVGHDWGAAVGWYLAAAHPDRVRSLAALSVPHPGAFAASMAHSTQALRSWYMVAGQVPRLPELLLAKRRGAVFEAGLRRGGLDAGAAARVAARTQQPGGMTGPLNWYRALPLGRWHLGPSPVPTLFVWGDQDRFVTRVAAAGCADHVTGPFRSETLPGVSHWIPDEVPDRVAALLLEHLS